MYLDEAATTKPLESTMNIIKPLIEDMWHNPSARYNDGRAVRKLIDNARCKVAELINAEPEEIYFTSGATESNNWVFRGFHDRYINSCNVGIITTPIEHKSIIEVSKYIGCTFCKVDNKGFVDCEDVKKLITASALDGRKTLVSIIHGNNEIGTIQKEETLIDIANKVHEYDGYFHMDATQTLGHIPIDVKKLGVDLMSASAQKIHGLKGTGFLYIKKGVEINPLIYGSQENGMRGGTENVIGIVTFGEAVKNVDFNDEVHKHTREMREYFIEKLVSKFNGKINGALGDDRLPNNINVTLPYMVTGEGLVYLLDARGVCISSGSACNSAKDAQSYVLKAIGLSADEISRSIRITIPEDINRRKIQKALYELKNSIEIFRN